MKRTLIFNVIILVFGLFIAESIQAKMLKFVRVGKYHIRVLDSGDQGEIGGRWFGHYYYSNFEERGFYSAMGFHLAAKNWEGPDGNITSYKIANAAHGSSDEGELTMPLPDEDGITIKRYFRYKPPLVTVDGTRTSDLWPQVGDVEEPSPDYIPGTADVLIESNIRTSLGITINQKVFAWSQSDHDDYVIYDWTFTNDGHIDTDDQQDIDHAINDIYFMRVTRPGPGWSPQRWFSAYGEHPDDSLRMVYSYPARTDGADYDNVGDPDLVTGYFDGGAVPFKGETVLFASDSLNPDQDDIAQPQMTGFGHPEWHYMKHAYTLTSEDEHADLYRTMSLGTKWDDGIRYLQDVGETVHPNTHHQIRMEDRGYQFTTEAGYGGRGLSIYSIGPYDLEPGESFRVVRALVAGSISPEKAWDVGQAWVDGSAADLWEGEWNLSPQQINYPELAESDNDKAKDSWIYTGKDSIFQNASNALENAQADYNIAVPPPPPSEFHVNSNPDSIVITWTGEESSETAADFAGYRLYRAIGNPGPIVEDDRQLIGSWELVAEFPGSPGSATHEYRDGNTSRGEAYYYAITAYDDPDVNVAGQPAQTKSLESGIYLTRSTQAAYVTREPGESLAEVRAVPNPWNISANANQFTGENRKILFMGLPPVCTIRIFSESGDLIKVLEHTDGSGDEPWGENFESFMVSESGQVVTSGIYIANIQTPEGQSKNIKFLIVR